MPMCSENFVTSMSVDAEILVIAFLRQLQKEGLINNSTYLNAVKKIKEGKENVITKPIQ